MIEDINTVQEQLRTLQKEIKRRILSERSQGVTPIHLSLIEDASIIIHYIEQLEMIKNGSQKLLTKYSQS